MSEAAVPIRKRTEFASDGIVAPIKEEGPNLSDCGEEAAEKPPRSLCIYLIFKEVLVMDIREINGSLMPAISSGKGSS